MTNAAIHALWEKLMDKIFKPIVCILLIANI